MAEEITSLFPAKKISGSLSMKNFLLNFIKIGIFCVLLTPFVYYKNFYFPYVGPKSLYFMAVTQLVFFAWVVLAKKYPEYRPNLKGTTLFLFLFLAAISLSALLGVNPSLSFWSKFERMTGVLMWLHLVGFYLAASAVMQRKDWLRIFGASAGFGVLMGLLSVLKKYPGMRGGGTLGNDSFFGTYLLINIFLAVYLFFMAVKKGNRSKLLLIFSGSSFLALAYFLFKSAANAAQISFLGGLVLLFCLWLAASKKKIIRLTGLVFLLFLVLGGLVVVIATTQKNSSAYSVMVDRFSKTTIDARLVIWDIAYKSFFDRPLLGYGPENFEYAFIRYYYPCLGASCGSSVWFDRAHNIIFDRLSSTGMLGLITYLALFASAIIFLWKGFFNNKIGFSEAGVFTALIAAYFIQNLTVFDMIASLMLIMLVLAFIDSTLAKKKDGKEEALGGFFLAALAGVFFICFTQFIVNPASAGHSVIVTLKSPFGSVARLDNYQKTLGLSPMGQYQIRHFFAQAFLNEEKKGKLSQEAKVKELEALTAELEKSINETPADYKSYYMLSQLYILWSSFDDSKITMAENASAQMIALSPANQKGYWMLAQVRLYQNRVNDAYDLAKKAYDLEPGNSSSAAVLKKIEAIKTKSVPGSK
jgi:O-antigen ligase